MIGKIKNAATALLRPKPSPSATRAPPPHQKDVFVSPDRSRLDARILRGGPGHAVRHQEGPSATVGPQVRSTGTAAQGFPLPVDPDAEVNRGNQGDLSDGSDRQGKLHSDSTVIAKMTDSGLDSRAEPLQPEAAHTVPVAAFTSPALSIDEPLPRIPILKGRSTEGEKQDSNGRVGDILQGVESFETLLETVKSTLDAQDAAQPPPRGLRLPE